MAIETLLVLLFTVFAIPLSVLLGSIIDDVLMTLHRARRYRRAYMRSSHDA